MDKITTYFKDPKNKDKNVLVLIVAALLLGGGAYVGFNQVNNSNTEEKKMAEKATPTQALTSETISPYTVIYGVWIEDNSVVKAYDLESGDNFELAKLPQNVKRITAIMPNSLYYINNTDENDHGTEIMMHSISGNQDSVVVSAEDGFGIDDYFISPNGQYMTTWEVSIAQGSRQLSGGRSRVYSFDLNNPGSKNLLYDEEADKPVHYPRGINDSGTVITDMFLPNSGPGWAYGMGSSDFTGASKKDAASMINGSYGRQPRISDDASQLVFAGYDGLYGSGTEQIDGVRRAVIDPNTIEIISADTLQREKLPNLSNKFVFDDVRFDPSNQYLFISQLRHSAPGIISTIRLYNLVDNATTVIPESVNKRGYAMLSTSHALVGVPNNSSEAMGNLGETYQFLNNNFEIINIKDGTVESLEIPHTNMQYIGIFPNSEVPAFANRDPKMSTDTLQMHTFVVKSKLMNDRINLQARSNASAFNSEFNNERGDLAYTQVQGAKVIAQALATPTFTPTPTLTITPTLTLTVTPTGALSNTPVPTVGFLTGTPSGGVSPSVTTNPSVTSSPSTTTNPSISANPSGTTIDIPGIGEFTIEEIEELIAMLEELLGIQEQETQN